MVAARWSRTLAPIAVAALLACTRTSEPRAPEPSPAATNAAAALGIDPQRAAALGLPNATSTRAHAGGRPIAWWSERLAKLRREGPQDLYRLTLERARLNGLAAVEKDGGAVAVTIAADRGARP